MNPSNPLSLLCVVEDPEFNPSRRLRIFQHLTAMRESGLAVEVMHHPKGAGEWREVLQKARGVDAVLWQKILMSQWNVLRLRMASKRLLFDLDDAVWMGMRNHVPYVSGKQARRFSFLVRFLDGAICGSPVLEAKVRSTKPGLRTALVPTSVPELPLKDHRAGGNPPVIVWVGMGANVAQVEAIEGELLSARAGHPFLLRIVSNRRPNFREFRDWEFVEWSEQAEYEAIRSADLGIMPLVDDGFTRGKCAYKALQYMACGLPVVASDVGVNREWIEKTGAGLVVKPGGWPPAIGSLLSNRELRGETGHRGWQTVRERFTHDKVGRMLVDSLGELIATR